MVREMMGKTLHIRVIPSGESNSGLIFNPRHDYTDTFKTYILKI